MIQRLRYRHLLTAPQGEQMDHDQQMTPIFDLIAQALHKWDILGLAKYDDLAYEDTVVCLLQQLLEAHDFHSVESLVFQAFAEQQGSNQSAPEDVLPMKALAEDIWHAWSQYLQRHEPSTFAQAHSRARMRRFYHPMSNSR
jgi:hypothetical protein